MPGNATESDLKDLFNELQVMEPVGTHPNIVNLIGACIDDGTYVVSCGVVWCSVVVYYGEL